MTKSRIIGHNPEAGKLDGEPAEAAVSLTAIASGRSGARPPAGKATAGEIWKNQNWVCPRQPSSFQKRTPRSLRAGVVLNQVKLREVVTGSHLVAKATGRRGANISASIVAARRTAGNGARRIQLDVGAQVGRIGDRVVGLQVLFQRELVGRRVNLAEVVDAGVGLGGGAPLQEVRNRDGRQQADDGHDDHDFDEGEARFTEDLGLFHYICFLCLRGGTVRQAGLFIITTLFALLPVATTMNGV